MAAFDRLDPGNLAGSLREELLGLKQNIAELEALDAQGAPLDSENRQLEVWTKQATLMIKSTIELEYQLVERVYAKRIALAIEQDLRILNPTQGGPAEGGPAPAPPQKPSQK